MLPFIPYDSTLLRSLRCGTVSNALAKSKKKTSITSTSATAIADGDVMKCLSGFLNSRRKTVKVRIDFLSIRKREVFA